MGALLLLFGQRAWRFFLGLLAFAVAGGASGYLLLYHTSGLPPWAAILISAGVGGAVSVAAVNS